MIGTSQAHRMIAETHTQLAGFIWSICNLLRGPDKRNEYRKVVLPLNVDDNADVVGPA